MEQQEKDVFQIPHFRDYWTIIAKRKKVIIISVIFFTLIGLLSIRKEDPIYVASAKIMVGTGERVFTSRGIVGGVYNYGPGGPARYQNEYELMRSSPVSERAAKMLGWEGKGAANSIHGAVQINPIFKGYSVTNIAFIVARSRDPKKAMDMANYTAKAYVETKEVEAREKIRKTYDMSSQQFNVIKKKLRDAQIAFNEFKRKHNIMGMDDINIDEQSAKTLGNELITTRTQISRLKSLLDSLKKMEAKGEISAAFGIIASNYATAIDQSIHAEIDKKERELLDLKSIYTEKHPLVIQKRIQIDELNKRLEESLSNSITNLNTTYNMLKAKEENLMYSLKLKNPDLGTAKNEYYTLKQEVDGNKSIYNLLVLNMKELTAYEEMTKMADVRILEWARLPRASEKKRNAMLLFAPFLGLLLGTGFVFFFEYMDNTIKTEVDVRQYLGLPVIGVIPHIDIDKEG